jgi:hypothetical protein
LRANADLTEGSELMAGEVPLFILIQLIPKFHFLSHYPLAPDLGTCNAKTLWVAISGTL